MPNSSAEFDSTVVSEDNVVALTDPLTGLGNRRRLMDKIRKLAAERADDPAPFTIGLANIDASSQSTICSVTLRAMKFCAKSPIGFVPVCRMAGLSLA